MKNLIINRYQHIHHQSHEHNHQHKLQHKTQTGISKVFAIKITQIADQPFNDSYEQLQQQAEEAGISEFIFGKKMALTPMSDNSNYSINGSEYLYLEYDLKETLDQTILSKVFKKYLHLLSKFDPLLVSDYLNNILDPLGHALQHHNNISLQITDRAINKNSSWRDKYGRLNISYNEIINQEQRNSQFKELRAIVACKMFPLGLGFTSKQDYQKFLVDTVFVSTTVPYENQLSDEYLSYKIKQKYQHQFGTKASNIWSLVKGYISRNKEIFDESGIQADTPRSIKRMAETFSCTKEEAKATIEILRQLPQKPIDDILSFKQQANSIKKHLHKKRIEFVIYCDYKNSQLRWQWSQHMQEYIYILKNDSTLQFIKQLDLILKLKLSEKQLINHTKSGTMLLEIFSQQLSHFNLTTEAYERFKNIFYINEAAFKTTIEILDFFESKKKRLRYIKLTFENMLKALDDKPKLFNYICNYQRDFLLADPNSNERWLKLKPLTKADVIRYLDLLPSSDYRKEKKITEKGKQRNKLAVEGRRLERYINNTLIQINDTVVDLSFLIPGNGGVEDTSGRKFTQAAIKQMIDDYIKSENKQLPLSDKKLSDLFSEDWAIMIARKTINKYRMSMNISSSQGRKDFSPTTL